MKTAKAIVMAICTMLLLGTFATAQWGSDRGRWQGRGRTVAPQILSNLLEAQDLLHNSVVDDGDIHAYLMNIKHEVDVAVEQMQQAMADAGMNPNRLPPPVATNTRFSSLRRVDVLLNDAHGLIASGREFNGDMRERERQADIQLQQALQHMDKIISIKEGGDRDRRGYGGYRRGY